MIKQFIDIRSRAKLFTGLSFTISGLMLGYTLLNLLVLEDIIPWKAAVLQQAPILASKYVLLLLPGCSLLICVLLYLDSRRSKLPPLFRLGEPDSPARLAIYRQGSIGVNFIAALLAAFCTLDQLNTAKQLPGFGWFVPLLCLIALILFAGFQLRRLAAVSE